MSLPLISSISDVPICFLDFDGVLHPDEVYYKPGKGIFIVNSKHALFAWTSILSELLEPHPDVRIVLSTSWVPMRSYLFAKSRLPPDLQARVIGATYNSRVIHRSEFFLMRRGEQVLSFVNRRCLRRWFAIDDDIEGWPGWCEQRLVKTDGAAGMSDINAQNAVREILSNL
ncbi:HAD domain-containing protein [Pseudoduganella umbonata]|uniref:HAD domain-containing protein n=1 Tax=Pseudoduganella umbonata TaxID=864828 RepID=UPI001586D56D